MPALSWPEIRNRATRFAKEWQDTTSERAEAQTFWNEFFDVFGVQRRRVAVYEKQVEKLPSQGRTTNGRIDVFWPATMLAEHKSAGADLTAAFQQALDYFSGLRDDEVPRYVVVSDFQRVRFYDLDDGTEEQFTLREFPQKISLFGFIAGYNKVRIRDEDPLNIKAVELLGELHDFLKHDGYGLDEHGKAGHVLQKFLVRILFCLFADDTGLFSPKDSFLDLVEQTPEDGSESGALLARLFQVLNTPRDKRQKSLEEQFGPFPHVNGHLFEETLPIPEFTSEMRRILLDCCRVQWASISPAIFGAMFQKIIDLDAKDRRRQIGAHYTSEANILKLIGPLFLDDLRAEFDKVKHNKNRLFEFQKKLQMLNFLDPACGCGNFLVITYRELRRLELAVLREAAKFGHRTALVFDLVKVDVDQFHGIEIEEFPAEVAQVAMWLTDHQMNVETGREFGEFFTRLPLEKSANIRHGNALRIAWEDFISPSRLNFILGNPPFVGAKLMGEQQRQDFEIVARGVPNAGLLDYVAAWYLRASQYLAGDRAASLSPDKKQFSDVRFSGAESPEGGPRDLFMEFEREDDAKRKRIRCAFVSTNSISQGEQVGVLWSELFRRGMKVHFAHRTFKWTNEAPGRAAVHCVIVGFGRGDVPRKRLFDYPDIDGPAHEQIADNINPYLVDGPDVLVTRREKPLCAVPEIGIGNKPIDGGNYLFTHEEKVEFLRREPAAEKWFRRWIGADEFINGYERWCLWLGDCPPEELQRMPEALKRVESVRQLRLSSKSKPTQKIATKPTRFHVENMPTSNFLVIPEVSSEHRAFIPIGFMDPNTLCSNLVKIVPDASLYHFGVLSSTMHMAWVRYVCGRMKSDFRYSANIVYNNFPWPQQLEKAISQAIEIAAQSVLDARSAHPNATLADIYDPNSMPPDLTKAHEKLDRAVDAAYIGDGGKKKYANDAERVAFLFRRYAELSSLIF